MNDNIDFVIFIFLIATRSMHYTHWISMMLRIRSFPILCNSQGPPKKKPNDQKLPPGPPMLPFIGNLHQLLGPTPLNQTFNNLAKQYGPIMHLKLGEVSAIVVSSPEVAQELLKTHDLTFAQRPQPYSIECIGYGSSGIMFCPYGNRFKQLRKLTTLQLLGAKRVLSFRSHREEERGLEPCWFDYLI